MPRRRTVCLSSSAKNLLLYYVLSYFCCGCIGVPGLCWCLDLGATRSSAPASAEATASRVKRSTRSSASSSAGRASGRVGWRRRRRRHRHRDLALGDFDHVNALYSGVELELPDATVETRVLTRPLTLDLSAIVCRNVSIGDVNLDWYWDGGDEETVYSAPGRDLAVSIELMQWSIGCTMDYHFEYVLGSSGSGAVTVHTQNNTAAAELLFTSEDFDRYPPHNVTVSACDGTVFVEDVQFEGNGLVGLVTAVLNALENTLRGTLANKIEQFLCQFLRELDEQVLESLQAVNEPLAPFFNGSVYPHNATNDTTHPVLHAEETMSVPRNVALLNYLDPGSGIALAVDLLLEQASSMFGRRVDDGSGGTRLAINDLIRGLELDDDGGIDIDLTGLMEALIVAGADEAGRGGGGSMVRVDTLLGGLGFRLERARVFGLDSFSRFDPLRAIGNHTLETAFALSTLRVELTAQLELSAPPDAATNASERLLESVTVSVDAGEVEASVAFLLAIDERELGAIRLGSLLHSDNWLPCFLSTVHKLEVVQLDIGRLALPGNSSGGSNSTVTVSGMQSPGLQRVLQTVLDIGLAMYGPALSMVLPDMLEEQAKTLIGGGLALFSMFARCRPPTSGSENSDGGDREGPFLDFRDLLLEPAAAVQYGANGTEPYGDLGYQLKSFVDDGLLVVLDPETGRTVLDTMVVDPLTLRQSGIEGVLRFEQDVVRFNISMQVGGLDANVELRVSDARLERLNSMGPPWSVLDPVTGRQHLLNNSATVGVGPQPLRLAATLLFGIKTEDEEIRNEVELGVGLHSTTIFVTLLAKVLTNSFLHLTLEHLLDVECWLAMIPAPSLDGFGFRVDGETSTLSIVDLDLAAKDWTFDMTCIDCSSSGLEDLADMLASPQGRAAAKQSAENAMDFVIDQVQGNRSFLQTQIDQMLVDAPRYCPIHLAYDPNATATQYQEWNLTSSTEDDGDSSSTEKYDTIWFLSLLILAAILVAVAAVVHLVLHWVVARRTQRWLKSLPEDRVLAIRREQQHQTRIEEERNRLTQPMYRSDQLPCLVRWLVPVVVVGNIALFLSGHLSVGGTVRIYLQFGGQSIVVDDFYTFSVAQSGIDLWNAGGKEMAIFILVFSGVWPYSKQFITLALWFLPPRMVSVSTRGSIFLWLDFLAKWSMVDVFVMILLISAFRLTIKSPNQPFLPEDLYSVEFLVQPLWGLYANLSAQLVTQITSHFIIHYHRRIVQASEEQHQRDEQHQSDDVNSEHSINSEELDLLPPKNDSGSDGKGKRGVPAMVIDNGGSPQSRGPGQETQSHQPEKLSQHAFTRPHRGESDKLVVRCWVHPGLVLFAMILAASVLLGCLFPSVAFDYLGLVGLAIESGQDFVEARDSYSIIQIAQLLMDQGRLLDTIKDKIGMGSVAGLLVLTTLIVPIVQTVALLAQWFFPLGLVRRNRLRVANEILAAWQYIEVYVISLLLSVWQLGPISVFMINAYCQDLSGTFATLVYYDLLKEEDAQCFRVNADVEPATYVLIAAAMLLAVVNTMISKSVAQYTKETIDNTVYPQESIEEFNDNISNTSEDAIHKMTSVPVLFTDRFRWLLRRENPAVDSGSTISECRERDR